MPLEKCILAISLFAMCLQVLGGSEAHARAKPESPSPDRQFAFRYRGDDEEGKKFELVRRKTGKVLARVAEADPDPGPSARFHMEVLWRPDSSAFAVTAMLWKRGSYVEVYLRHGATFRKVEMPELQAEITDEIKAGKEYPHMVELNSQTAKRWLKGGALLVGIENIQDGSEGTITALRTVVLGFDRPGPRIVVAGVP